MRYKFAHLFLPTFFILLFSNLFAQQGVIRGVIYDKATNDPIPFATVQIQNTSLGSVSDEVGQYEIANLLPGVYNLEVSYVGYAAQVIFEVEVSNARIAEVNIYLLEDATQLEGVTVVASPFARYEESPLSVNSIGINEIKRAPGGNRDISKVVRSLPGVASTPSFRNDIIIRGGAPGENKFYLDGIEIPTINHFQTQGSSGGPVGIINVDLIKEVDVYTGAFPATRGNALSSVFDFKLKEGRSDKAAYNMVVGASDLGFTFEGPTSPKSTFLISARRSYLQLLFKALQLPFLPIYNDMQFKYLYTPNNKSRLTILGIGAIDDFKLNLDANETEEQRYLLNQLPVNKQWNYTLGLKYDRFHENGLSSFILSRNTLNLRYYKYRNNDESNPANLITDYNARETDHKMRYEYKTDKGNSSLTLGALYEFSFYDSRNLTQITDQGQVITLDYSTEFFLHKYGVFLQGNTKIGDRFGLSFGTRVDGNNYSSSMSNPFSQFSPRIAGSYELTPSVSLNFNTGIYYQLPPNTILGYKNALNELENKSNGVKYIRSSHLNAGLGLNLKNNARTTLETFYKKYSNYPFSLTDSISLANLGADFGAIGNVPVQSISTGRSYGVEWMYQQKLWKGFYGLLAYTWVRSEFSDKSGELIPSSWDNQHLVSITGGKRFNKNWELNMRWLYSGGAPYTPYNLTETLRRTNWDLTGYGIPDYEQINTLRTSAYHQMDIRIDKKYFYQRWTLDIYFDVQNLYGFQIKQQDFIDVLRDGSGTPIPDPLNTEFYQAKYLENVSGTVIPTLGIIIEL